MQPNYLNLSTKLEPMKEESTRLAEIFQSLSKTTSEAFIDIEKNTKRYDPLFIKNLFCILRGAFLVLKRSPFVTILTIAAGKNSNISLDLFLKWTFLNWLSAVKVNF